MASTSFVLGLIFIVQLFRAKAEFETLCKDTPGTGTFSFPTDFFELIAVPCVDADGIAWFHRMEETQNGWAQLGLFAARIYVVVVRYVAYKRYVKTGEALVNFSFFFLVPHTAGRQSSPIFLGWAICAGAVLEGLSIRYTKV